MRIHTIIFLACVILADSFVPANAAPYVVAGIEVGKTLQSQIPACSSPVRSKATERICWTTVPTKLLRAKLRFGELKYSNGPNWMRSATARAFVDNSTEIVEFLSFDSEVLHPTEAIDTIITTLGIPDYTQSKPTLTWAHWDANGVKVSGDNSTVGRVDIESSVYRKISNQHRLGISR
jgi:hypothetical protein